MAKTYIFPPIKQVRVHVIYTGGIIGKVRNNEGNFESPVDGLQNLLRNNPNCHDKSYKLRCERGENSPLVLPDVKNCTYRVVYDIVEYVPEIESSSIQIEDWERIARDLGDCYERYDGFVILHGVDTLAFTASRLAFMLENLRKPVVLTGGTLPLLDPHSDGNENFVGALLIAGNCNIPEVLLYFGNKVLRGCRSTKKFSSTHNAYDSPNMSPIGSLGNSLSINSRQIFRPLTSAPFCVFSKMEPNVGLLRMYPGIKADILRTFLSKPMLGVVIQSYDNGRIPVGDDELMAVIQEAIDNEVVIVNISQCMAGHVPDSSKGHSWMQMGVASGHDMTPEAALAKLSYVLGQTELNFCQKLQMMEFDLRGEMSVPSIPEIDLIGGVAISLNISKCRETDQMSATFFPALVEAAVRDNDAVRLKCLKQCGANLSETNSDGRTALHLACFLGHKNCIQALLDYGCPVDLTDRFNRTPLHEAIDTDNHEVIKMLRNAGAELTEEPGELAEKLRSLAEHDRVERLESYRLAGANLEVKDAAGRTPLHHACQLGKGNVVQYLVPFYNNPSAKDTLDLSPIQYAKVGHHCHIVCLLCADKTCQIPASFKINFATKETYLSQ